jgi:diguanylate cyclase (GGDEF)-like protein
VGRLRGPVKRSLNETDTLFEGPSGGKAVAPEVIGHIFVEFDKTELANKQRQLLQRGLAIVLLGLLALAALAIAMADNLARPVMRLVHAINGMSSGHLDTRVPATSSGELGILENGFNEMATRIEEVHLSMQSRIEEATAQLAFQARHDALTGLLNRREFEHRLEKALAGVQAGGDEFAVLFIDLDRFKQVNDNCGYLAGDELLRQMALLFQGRLRDEDTLARLGGDEFSIMLASCSGPRANQVAEDICGLAAAYRFIWQDKVFAIGASIGITTVNRKVRNINEILAAGDAACHRAKQSGRNRVCEQEALPNPERRLETSNWASRIANALAEDRLLVEAMPLRPLQHATNNHVVELTARLNEPGQPPVTLAALSDAAERYDLAPAIDQRLIDTAIAAQLRAKRHRKTLHCLIPISRASVGNRETIDYVTRSLSSRSLSGHRLCFIFSEDTLTHLTSQAMEFSREMRALGCQIGLDDFGGGLSSFTHLRSILPSYVKLSRSLTGSSTATGPPLLSCGRSRKSRQINIFTPSPTASIAWTHLNNSGVLASRLPAARRWRPANPSMSGWKAQSCALPDFLIARWRSKIQSQADPLATLDNSSIKLVGIICSGPFVFVMRTIQALNGQRQLAAQRPDTERVAQASIHGDISGNGIARPLHGLLRVSHQRKLKT